MIAVVLVGGFGTRLRPLTNTTPKALLPIAGRRMLERIVDQLAAGGVTEIVLALGFKTDAFTEAFPAGRISGLPMRAYSEPEPLDTAGAIAFAARSAGLTERFLVVNGDIITDLDVREVVAAHEAWGSEATIHLVSVEDPTSFGVADIDPDGSISRFVEKPARHEAPSNLINAGTYVLEPSVLELIPVGGKVSVERVVFPALAARGSLRGFATDDYWLDTGRPELLLQANEDIYRGRRRLARPVPATADVYIDADANVSDSSLGSGCTVAAGARVERSVLLDGGSVAANASVRASILGIGVRVGAGALVEDSMLGDGVTVAPGEVLRGARRPEV